MNWWGIATAVLGTAVSTAGTYMAVKAQEEKAEDMKELMREQAAYRTKQREMEALSKQKTLEKTTRARKATVANLMYNRGFSAEHVTDPFKRLETEFQSATSKLEESAELAAKIDDNTLAQAELDATPVDGLGTVLAGAGGQTLTLLGSAAIDANPAGGNFKASFTYTDT